MNALEAKQFALALLRRRLAKGWSRASIQATSYEGSFGPSMTGYLMSAGKITVPGAMHHDSPDTHTMKLRDLLDEIEHTSPQAELFAEES